MSRAKFAIVAALACAGVLALWFATRAGTSGRRGATVERGAATPAPASASARPARTAMRAQPTTASAVQRPTSDDDPAFAALSEGERPSAMRSLAADLDAWLVERSRASLDPELHPVDCAVPPCLLIVDYDAAVGGEDFTERIALQLPQLRDMPGLQHESRPLANGRRRAFFYYARPGVPASLVTGARDRIDRAASAAPALAAR